MFSITFTKNGREDCTQVGIRIDLNLPIKQHILRPTWECDSQFAAELLRRHLEKEYHDLVEMAHCEAYEQGFKDGKQHQRKKKWFRRQFCNDDQSPCC